MHFWCVFYILEQNLSKFLIKCNYYNYKYEKLLTLFHSWLNAPCGENKESLIGLDQTDQKLSILKAKCINEYPFHIYHLNYFSNLPVVKGSKEYSCNLFEI